ncbi:MAG: ERF family protein, partial [Lachnospiraceae bacterium]|nr:ERF family protein [Lachnospiraceae bacterium]
MNIFEAITYIMNMGYAVGKDRKNEQQRFFYRGIDDVMNVFQPLMAEAGIFIVPEVLEAKR